ncbi:MAG: pyrimidine-nucleoside phosphorylase [Candidatus Izimaplasma sp.]|nr:pyrimidine-nucleoside phosphorylase [Candidatus Izimaplasma bacterium]
MRMVDLIEKKRDNLTLTKEEINYMIQEYTNETIPDYQMSAMMMAIYFNGMTDEEATHLTMAMLNSGDQIDLSSIPGKKVDKHSTGGVGDKTTLVLGPLVASTGVKVAKLSGRGLGHTGGTLDKLESIPEFNINLSIDDFLAQVKNINIAVAGQTKDITPADKLLYALRDVTATVPSIPLIASSIMSKKLASGSDVIVLDVKIGEGAFMKTIEEARELSQVMVNIGNSLGKKTIAFLTDMSQPLGYAVGNKLEVIEAIETLKGNGPDDLTELCLEIGSYMVYNADITDSLKKAKALIKDNIKNNKALEKQAEFIKAQNGKLPELNEFINVKKTIDITAKESGYIKSINALTVGISAMKLGAGRKTKEDDIDPDVGVVLNKKVGDKVTKGDTLATIYTNDLSIDDVLEELNNAFVMTDKKIKKRDIIFEIIS